MQDSSHPAGSPSPEVDLPRTTLSAHFGEAVWLLSQSADYRHVTLADLEWLLMPPLLLGQHKLWRNVETRQPVALALWALASIEVEAKLRGERDTRRLVLADWRSGIVPVVVTLVAPFGGAEIFMSDLEQTRFAAGACPESTHS